MEQSLANNRLLTISRHISYSPHQVLVENADAIGIRIESSVRRALLEGQPVVALESTIISHGMPYPQNFETAKEVEAVVRRNGAVPATIAILDGTPCIGLTEGELEKISVLGSKVTKTARRDIPVVIAKRQNGATTVSATVFFAAKVGIYVFVTGGIGGVHRFGETTMDISSDLIELGRTPIAVICAGVKSILDIPRTLEYLETQGVTVVSYSTEEFPAFFTRKSGCKAPCRADTPKECASIMGANIKYGLQGGVLIGVPIPEAHSAAAQSVESAIETSLQEASNQGIQGNAVTPFLLKRVAELTGGASLAANIALIKNNAQIGAQIAAALCQKA